MSSEHTYQAQSRGMPRRQADPDAVVVMPVPPGAAEPAARPPGIGQRDVHVAPNLRELVIATPVAEDDDALRAQGRDLNQVVHGVLIIGLAISTACMLAGVGLALFNRRDLPTTIPDLGELFARVVALRPSGFVGLGLLVLIATPMLRVVGSIGAFVYEHDWRFAAITCLVLGILITSIVLGHG